MEHLNGISSEQYIYGINAAWQLYKKLQHNFPLRFRDYITDSSFKTRLSYNQNDDRWYMLKVQQYLTHNSSLITHKPNDNPLHHDGRDKHPSNFAKRSNSALFCSNK